MCCDVCSPTTSVNTFNRPSGSRQPRQPRHLLVRTVTKEQQERLHQALEIERENIMGSSVGYCMLYREGNSFTNWLHYGHMHVHSIYNPKLIYHQYILVVGLRRELVSRIYDTFVSFFST